MLKLPYTEKKEKYTPEELANISLEDVKKMIVAQDPKAFDKKSTKKKASKKSSDKKK
jgi:DNA topoisomerase-1